MTKKYFYPVRDPDEPRDVRLFPVPEMIYRSISPEIWRMRKQMQRSGRCLCPKFRLWACDADCAVCPYSAGGNTVSLDAPLDEEGRTLDDILASDDPSPEEIVIEKILLEDLKKELFRLDPTGRRICELIASGNSERKAAKILGVSKTAFRYRWLKTKRRLEEKLKDYF